MRTRAPTGTAYIRTRVRLPVCVHDGTTLEVVPRCTTDTNGRADGANSAVGGACRCPCSRALFPVYFVIFHINFLCVPVLSYHGRSGGSFVHVHTCRYWPSSSCVCGWFPLLCSSPSLLTTLHCPPSSVQKTVRVTSLCCVINPMHPIGNSLRSRKCVLTYNAQRNYINNGHERAGRWCECGREWCLSGRHERVGGRCGCRRGRCRRGRCPLGPGPCAHFPVMIAMKQCILGSLLSEPNTSVNRISYMKSRPLL